MVTVIPYASALSRSPMMQWFASTCPKPRSTKAIYATGLSSTSKWLAVWRTPDALYINLKTEGEEVKGVWYQEEIQPITANEYRIKRVIKRRRNANCKENCLSSGSDGLINSTLGFQSRLNTMSAPIDDEFFITLPSNATQGSPAGNRPSRYETRLAHPL